MHGGRACGRVTERCSLCRSALSVTLLALTLYPPPPFPRPHRCAVQALAGHGAGRGKGIAPEENRPSHENTGCHVARPSGGALHDEMLQGAHLWSHALANTKMLPLEKNKDPMTRIYTLASMPLFKVEI